jgi:hypothetical protein
VSHAQGNQRLIGQSEVVWGPSKRFGLAIDYELMTGQEFIGIITPVCKPLYIYYALSVTIRYAEEAVRPEVRSNDVQQFLIHVCIYCICDGI